jgi:hypothetical protein
VHGAVGGEHTLRPQPTQNLNQMGLRTAGKLMVHDRVNGLPPVFEVLREKAPQFVPAGANSRPARASARIGQRAWAPLDE